MSKAKPIAITIPRSFAALSRVASSDAKADPWRRSVLVEALPKARVRGTACNGFAILRMESVIPSVNLDLFTSAADSAPPGTRAAPGADDLATVVKSVKPPRDGDAPPVEILVGDAPSIRCGSEARRVQIEGDSALSTWPKKLDDLIPSGFVVCAQVFSTELLRDLLSAILAAGAESVKVEMRGGITALRMAAEAVGDVDVVGVLMPIKQPGETGDEPAKGVDTVTLSMDGHEPVTVTGKQFDAASRSVGKAKR